MTGDELAAALPQYAAGLEAELSLLKQLRTLAYAQQEATRVANVTAMDQTADARNHIVAALVLLEQDLKPVRQAFIADRETAQTLSGFEAILALHRDAVALIGEVLQADRNTLTELKSAEAARRASAKAVECGEATLAAYRRVLTPSLGGAALIDREG